MATITSQYVLQFAQPWWLLTALLAVPMIALAWRNLASLGRARQVLAIVFRCLVMLLLAAVLARPMLTDKAQQLTLITVIDRSLSVPEDLKLSNLKVLDYLRKAASNKDPNDQLAMIDVAESAYISQLPSTGKDFRERNTNLTGNQSKLSSGLELGLAIAPPNTSVRMLLVSDGNETAGDLKEAARIAAANGVPVDVLPLRYQYKNEVVFKNLVAPVKGRSGQTVPLRFVLQSTGPATGQLMLTLNGKSVRLDANSPTDAMPVELKAGTNVKTVSIPLGTRGMHEFAARFVPDDPKTDSLSANNAASAITFVAGPGHVLVVDNDTKSGVPIVEALKQANIDARQVTPSTFATKLADLADCDAIVLANVECGAFSQEQQEMLVRYVGELGGGLVMSGGPNSFGAGGWIGSPVADIMPVNMDPPQKQQMPKGALVLIMHACEIDQGNFWGKKVAAAAVNALSRLDLVGIIEYGTTGAGNHWIYPLSEVGDKSKVLGALKNMQLGDMPDFGAPMQDAYDALKPAKAGQKHVIIISDGDPQPPNPQLLQQYKQSGITVSGVVIGSHSMQTNLAGIVRATGGNFYDVQDPRKLPQIFIKEAQVVRRSLIVEEKTSPSVVNSVNEIIRGLTAVPPLEGYVLTERRQGLNYQLILAAPNKELDPLLAAGQHGLGRTVAFTSAADGKWGPAWLAWGGHNRFWEQIIRYAGKSSLAGDLEVFADVEGRQVTLTVETVDASGKFMQLSQMAGQVIAPDMSLKDISLTQVGPGRYRSTFQADAGGCYLVTLMYKLPGSDKQAVMHSAVVVPYAPEFRDLTDNAALLAEVAHMTGGRIISGKPEQADLFSRTGVRLPQTTQPLTGILMMVWLGAFLLDVATRRIAVDFRAIGRRMKSWVPTFRRTKTADATIDRLKGRRQEYLDQLAKKKTDKTPESAPKSSAKSSAVAGRKYQPSASAGAELDTSAMQESAAPPPLPGDAPAKPEPPKPVDRGHLQQLLDAKRKSKDKLK